MAPKAAEVTGPRELAPCLPLQPPPFFLHSHLFQFAMLSSVAFSISWGGGEERKEGRGGTGRGGDAFMVETRKTPVLHSWVVGESLRARGAAKWRGDDSNRMATREL